jgi:hypothetical protein
MDCATTKCRAALKYCAGGDTELFNIVTYTPSLSKEDTETLGEYSAMLTTALLGLFGGLCAAALVVSLARNHSMNNKARLQVKGMAAKIIKSPRQAQDGHRSPHMRRNLPAKESLRRRTRSSKQCWPTWLQRRVLLRPPTGTASSARATAFTETRWTSST